MREVYIDAYLASAENYRTLRAEIKIPLRIAPGMRSSGSNHALGPAPPAKKWIGQPVDTFVILFDNVFSLKRLHALLKAPW
jgi:hypothetical protein